MPIPKYDLPEYEPDENELKVDVIMQKLSDMGYSVATERDAVQVIDSFVLDKSQFDFPYGSFEGFKKHVLAGEFDYDEESFFSSKEECEELDLPELNLLKRLINWESSCLQKLVCDLQKGMMFQLLQQEHTVMLLDMRRVLQLALRT